MSTQHNYLSTSNDRRRPRTNEYSCYSIHQHKGHNNTRLRAILHGRINTARECRCSILYVRTTRCADDFAHQLVEYCMIDPSTEALSLPQAVAQPHGDVGQ